MQSEKNKKNEVIVKKRVEATSIDINKDVGLTKYNDLKEQLKLNLRNDINNKIQRMKILYEIKKEELYKYDGFDKFDDFIRSYIISKTQAYKYVKIYEKVLEGAVSIDNIKEKGFNNVYSYIQKSSAPGVKQEDIKEELENIPIRILVKDKEVYSFCKEDTKRLYFIIEYIFNNKKDVLMESISQYEKYRKERKRKRSIDSV